MFGTVEPWCVYKKSKKEMKVLKHLVALLFLSSFSYSKVAGQTIQSELRPGIQRIVSKLRHEPILHLGAPVGFSGLPETKNKYYRLYQKLSLKAADNELVILTNDSSKTIVLYSFLILYSRNYGELKAVFLKNMKDTSDVWIAGGCTGSVTKVNSFMLRQLNHAFMDSMLPYMTQDEYDRYMKEFGTTE